MNVLLVVVCDLVVGAVAFLVSDPAPYDIILMDVIVFHRYLILIFFCKKSQRQNIINIAIQAIIKNFVEIKGTKSTP